MMTAPELDFSSRGRLPANVHYVGPAFEPYEPDWRSPWPSTNADPLVVVSLSTSYMNQQHLAQRILGALAEMPVRGLLTAGPALDLSLNCDSRRTPRCHPSSRTGACSHRPHSSSPTPAGRPSMRRSLTGHRCYVSLMAATSPTTLLA
jgi:hypothetical protein